MYHAAGSNWKCPYYKDGFGCRIYETRPEICRGYTPTLRNCLKARMGHAGFNAESWYQWNVTEYCKTQLHRNTGLDSFKDYKAVFLYSLIIPYLVSEEKMKSYLGNRTVRTLIQLDFRIEQLIDLDADIPDCIREYLQLNEKCQTIKDIFNPSKLRLFSSSNNE
jgi:Fe-S-cluster containining protein